MQTAYLLAGVLLVLFDVVGAGVAVDAPVFAFLWCLCTLVAGAGFVEAAGALEPCAISAAPEIISVIISFFMVFSLEAYSAASTPMDALLGATVHEASFNKGTF